MGYSLRKLQSNVHLPECGGQGTHTGTGLRKVGCSGSKLTVKELHAERTLPGGKAVSTVSIPGASIQTELRSDKNHRPDP